MPRLFSVLLVEDHDPLRSALDEWLRQRGWLVHAVDRPENALQVARKVRLDLSILDFHLPGATGCQLLAMLREQVGLPLPSIMMSGEATREETAEALRLGVFTFLRKPLELSLLQRSLDELIRHHFGPNPDAGGLPPQRPGPGS